jgi:magnesium transporter
MIVVMNEVSSFPGKDLETIARSVTYRPDTRLSEFRALALSERSAVFNLLSPKVSRDLLEELNFSEALELLDHLDPQKVYQALSRIKDHKRRERFVSRLKSDRYEKCEYFLSFHPQATLALIHLNYVYLPDTTTIGETASAIEEHARYSGKIPTVLVYRAGELLGEVPLATLVRERNTNKLKNFIKPVRSIAYNAPKEKILSLLTDSPNEKIVLLDADGSVLGIVFSSDVADLLEAQPAATLYSFAGVEPSERPFDSVGNKVKGRYRWLIINLATCFLVGGVVSLFDDTIQRFVTLAIFMPMVAGMGGNASTQTLAVMVRGIAIGEVSIKNGYPAVVREVLAGFLNGLITGVLLVPVALIFGLNIWISLIAGLAVVFNLMVAGLFGATTPLLLRHFGRDPATSSGIFISTATDVLGLLFFLSIATLFLT